MLKKGVTTNGQLQQLTNRMHILEVFSCTTLSTERVRRNENGITNLNNAEGSGTHWVAYAKKENWAIFRILAVFDYRRN